ncbi:hypothetical protein GIB67_039663 [Kingdonia uniflora]|uniref:SWIM-type domain-containing protein n=1 Tax=Kingdonia uniflora TaxID=39325 RepID=A0A7J7MDJ1_9MAGN|nr:hypothetical protein GIB67_039663 [Kingdonia uniflora]
MNGVQLYTIVYFGGDIELPKIGSIISYVGRSAKLTSLRVHSSYEDFITFLEETSEICREDWKSTTKDIGSGKGLSTTKAGGPLRHNSFPDPKPQYRGYPETNGRGLDPHRFGPLVDDDDVPQLNNSFKTIRTDVLFSNKPSILQSNVYLSNEPVLTNVSQSNELFKTIPTDVPFLNEPCISQSNIHLSNEPVLTNVHLLNEPMLTNVPLSIEPEPIIGQTEPSAKLRFKSQPEQVKDLVDFWFKSVVYTEDPYDFSKEFNIGDLYRDMIELKNHIRAYAVVSKFNLEHVLSNEYKIVIRGNFEHAYQLLTRYFAEVRHRVAYTNHVESWNKVILKVRDLPIHVSIRELCRIYSKISYTYREEAEKSQARLTSWATDHCESIKFVADSLTCRVRTSRHHFQMTSYGRADFVNIEDDTCSCRCWQTMGIPCEHGVRALSLINVDPTIRVSEYFINDTYKVVYKPIWIPIRGIKQYKILKTDLRVRVPIPIVQVGRPYTQRKRREKMSGIVTKLRFFSRYYVLDFVVLVVVGQRRLSCDFRIPWLDWWGRIASSCRGRGRTIGRDRGGTRGSALADEPALSQKSLGPITIVQDEQIVSEARVDDVGTLLGIQIHQDIPLTLVVPE